MWPRFQNQPVCTGRVNQFVLGPLENTMGNTIVVQYLIGQAVQSLYWLLLSNRALRFLSQSTVDFFLRR